MRGGRRKTRLFAGAKVVADESSFVAVQLVTVPERDPFCLLHASSGWGGAPLAVSLDENWWRRRESNPGPQGFQSTFVHVRSRHNADDGVRGFGRDLSLTESQLR